MRDAMLVVLSSFVLAFAAPSRRQLAVMRLRRRVAARYRPAPSG